MSKNEKKKLVAARGQCKASFTRLEKYLVADSGELTVEDLQVRKQNLIENYTRYKEITINLSVFEDTQSDTDIDEDDDDCEERYLAMMATIQRLLKPNDHHEDSPNNSAVTMAKLPALDIPYFNGKDISAYKPFIEMFKAVVHHDTRVTNVQKLCFLKKYLQEEPLQIIDSLPIIGKSYDSALELLQNRYDNQALLVDSHVTKLLDLPSIQRSTAKQIRDLVAAVRQHLTALQNLGEPVTQWNSILSRILLRKIDPLTVRLFHADRDTTMVVSIDELLSFMDKRAASLEASSPGEKPASGKPKSSVNIATVSNDKVSSKCPLCSQGHKLFKCEAFIALSPQKRIEFVTKHKLCQLCLVSHLQKCRYKFKCSTCHSSTHNALIHPHDERPGPEAKQGENKNTQQVTLHIAQPTFESVLLPTAKVLVTGVNNKKILVRALLDCGSQTSFCTTALANRLGLPQFDLQKNIATLGDTCHNNSTKGIQLHLESLVNSFQMNVTCSIINKITSKQPQKQVDLSNFVIPMHVALADKEFYIPGDISLLLGSDIFFKIILDGKIEGGPADPILLNTQLGYIISSTSPIESNTTIAMHTTICPNPDICVRQFWEAEKVPEFYHESLPENEYSEKVFTESVSLHNNKFQVNYPLKVELQAIDPSNSYAISLQRLYNLEKRFLKDPEYHNLYKNFIHEYIELGHAKSLDIKNCDPIDEPRFFLPHHGVIRPLKQGNKLRVVFDGSAKNKNSLCLNDYMYTGPVVQNSLFDILLMFRLFRYTLQCDISHMYRRIEVAPNHRCLQNILWRENGVMNILQLQTVTYGLTGSAFLATRCLIELARKYKDQYPMASAAIINNSYIDDIQTGHDTLEGVHQLKKELISLMGHASLNLHKWISNNPEVLLNVPQDELGITCRNLDRDRSEAKILGISYDTSKDVFIISGEVITPTNKIHSKRSVLSSVSRLYDPLGLVGPLTMRAKLFLRELWQRNLDWDSPLPFDLEKAWNQFYANIITMPEIIVPRYVQTDGADDVQLVGYCDASSTGYGCCIYVKVVKGDSCYIHLLCSRSRLNGINSKLTIPKLELNGSLLLAKLISHVSSVLNIKNVHLFCDSKIVLGWLQLSPMKVPAYIGNRIREIKRLTDEFSWHFTPGLLNPADILSRGADPMDIQHNLLWKDGPDYLKVKPSNYNFYLANIESPLLLHDACKQTCLIGSNNEAIHPLFERYSNLYKMVRVTVYILRFINSCKKIKINFDLVSVGEYREALTNIIKGIQWYYFSEELRCLVEKRDIKTSLKSLHPFIDDKGVCRVGGRIHNAKVNYSKKYPIILPKHCHVTKLIIQQEHLILLHGGIKLVLSHLSQKYYILNAVREVKNVIHKCVVCQRHRAEASKQLMGSLPNDRVNSARVFQRVGIDYCGPFDIKQSTKRNSIISKGYVALFVCFSSKAIHIEVVSDMSTDTFLAAFKRFVARRGLPSDIYCDNASTFKGANNNLTDLFKLHNSKDFQEAVHSYALQREIKFHFIPTYSPNHGGLWEAAVKSAKHHLKRISGCRTFTYEQFNTVMIEIEGILNSRPLFTVTSQDLDDFSCLTPGHFIIGSSLTAVPQPDLTDIPLNRLRFWRSCEQVRQHFWKIWSKDYLSTLNQRTKWRKTFENLKVGTIVLLINSNTPPLQWPMAKVTRAIQGRDGIVRVVEVQTSNGKLHIRAVSKIVVLPTE